METHTVLAGGEYQCSQQQLNSKTSTAKKCRVRVPEGLVSSVKGRAIAHDQDKARAKKVEQEKVRGLAKHSWLTRCFDLLSSGCGRI